MAHYQFESEWVLSAPIDRVFDVMTRPEEFSQWWSSVKNSRLIETGDSDGLGAKARYSIKSPLGYKMHFEMTVVDFDRPNRIHSLARGDLIGTGTHLFESRGESTAVTYLWYVSTTKRWMNVLEPVAKPLFAWAYHHAMREGCAGLAKHLGARLISTSSKLVDKPTPVPTS